MGDADKTQDSTAEPIGGVSEPSPKKRQSFANVRRALSDDELTSPAAQRMLLDEIERLERDCEQLGEFRERFYAADKRADILEERSKRSLSGEIVFGACLTVGAAAMGYAPAAWSQQPTGYLSLTFGVVLVIGGIASRVVQR